MVWWFALGLVAMLIELASSLAVPALQVGALLDHGVPAGRYLLGVVFAFAIGAAGAAVLAAPLRALSAWPGGWLTALVLPGVALGLLRLAKVGLACGMLFTFITPDHRVVACFVGPLLIVGMVAPFLSGPLSAVTVGPVVDEMLYADAQVVADTPGGRVEVPAKGQHFLMSTVDGLAYLVGAGPAAAGVWAATHTRDPALAWTVLLLGLGATGTMWWTLRALHGMPRGNRLTLAVTALATVALAWGVAVTPVGAVLVDYWHRLGRYHLELAVPLAVLVALLVLSTLTLPLQQRAFGGWIPVNQRIVLVVTQGGLLVLLIAFQPDPVVWPAAATLAGLIVLAQASTMVRTGIASEYRPSLADLYRGPGSDNSIGVWVYDAVLRRPTRPDFTLVRRLLAEEFGTLLDEKFSPTLEVHRLLLRPVRAPVGPVSAEDQAERWRELYDMAMGAIEAAALTGNPHPRLVRRYTIMQALRAESDAVLAERRGRYDDMLAHARRAVDRWAAADLPVRVSSCRLTEARALVQVGRTTEADALTARLAADPMLDGLHRRELALQRALQAPQRGDPAGVRPALDEAGSSPVTRRDRRALRATSRTVDMGQFGLGWLWSARSQLAFQERRLAATALLLGDVGEGRVGRRRVRFAVQAVPRKSPEWYLLSGIRHLVADRGTKAYHAYGKAIALSRDHDDTAILQQALYLRATLLVGHGALDGARRDLLAATAAADEMRAAAVDAAGRIAVGATAAMIYELAADQILEATADRPEPLAVVSGGDMSGALTAYALSELARSRELVHHLAGTVAADMGTGMATEASPIADDAELRDRIAELRDRLETADEKERPALEEELRRARAARDALWSDPATEESDLAALRAGRPADYAEIRAILAARDAA
jgi:hypothetical protein